MFPCFHTHEMSCFALCTSIGIVIAAAAFHSDSCVMTCSVRQAQLTSCNAEKVTIMQKLCTDELWPTQHWGTTKAQRMTSTNGRKLSQAHQLVLKHRYRNFESYTQGKEQSKSSNLRTFLAANNGPCISDWELHWGLPSGEKNNRPHSHQRRHPSRRFGVIGCCCTMESQREDGRVHKAAKSCHRVKNGAWKNPQVSMLSAPRWQDCHI